MVSRQSSMGTQLQVILCLSDRIVEQLQGKFYFFFFKTHLKPIADHCEERKDVQYRKPAGTLLQSNTEGHSRVLRGFGEGGCCQIVKLVVAFIWR